jgi:hypothetical protein
VEAMFSEKNFSQVLKLHDIVVMGFSATWDEQSREFGKIWEKDIVPKYEDDRNIAFLRVDFDQNIRFARSQSIDIVPSVRIWFRGNPIEFLSKNQKGKMIHIDHIDGLRSNLPKLLDEILCDLQKNEIITVAGES